MFGARVAQGWARWTGLALALAAIAMIAAFGAVAAGAAGAGSGPQSSAASNDQQLRAISAAKGKATTKAKAVVCPATKQRSTPKAKVKKARASAVAKRKVKRTVPARCRDTKRPLTAKTRPKTVGAPVGAQSTRPGPAAATPAATTPGAGSTPTTPGAGSTPTTTTPTIPTVPTEPAPVPVHLQVDFLKTASTAPAGYAADNGQAYDATRGYGWVAKATGQPVSLVGNGRDRDGVDPNPLLDTLMSMQLGPASDGVHVEGAWKAAVPNGTYSVTVAAGDPQYADSTNVINVEGTKALDFTPTMANSSQTKTVVVTVTDGFVNVDAAGGSNTKIQYLAITTVTPGAPYVTATTPANNVTGVCLDGAVTVQLSQGVDVDTANADGARLLAPSGAQVAAYYNTDGAYSNVTLVPTDELQPKTRYTIQATSALTDPLGHHYQPFTTTFTTGTSACQQQAPNVAFAQSTFDFANGSGGYSTFGPSALALGPDPDNPTQLWAAFGTGNILVYNLNPATGQAVGAPTQVGAFKFQRVVSGLRFDPASTASNIKLWVSNGQFGCDLAAIGVACDDFTGAISTLTGTSTASLTKTNIVTGLPRSVGNHMNNGIDFGPDGALYVAQGANNGYGDPDSIWGNREDVPLSAAVLRVDVNTITSPPYSANTSTGYNPYSPTAKVTLYATGTRNPFSVVWHSNGKLYAPVNESSNGNSPADPAGGAPALTDLPAYDDYFTQIVQGKYYGHPNPSRGEYRLNGGNPTAGVDPFEVREYPVGTQPNANWREPDLNLGEHRSADGSAEFKSDVFGANLKGQILVTEYSQGKDIIAVKLDANGDAVSQTKVADGFYNPLPIVIDNATGRVYVGEYGSDPLGDGGQLTLLTPTP